MEKRIRIAQWVDRKPRGVFIGSLFALIPTLLLANLLIDNLEIAQRFVPLVGLGFSAAGITAGLRGRIQGSDLRVNVLGWAIVLAGLAVPLSFLPNEKQSVFTYEIAFFLFLSFLAR